MAIKYHSVLQARRIIAEKGFSESQLSLAMGRTRTYVSQTLKRGSICPKGAAAVIAILKVEFDDLFKYE